MRRDEARQAGETRCDVRQNDNDDNSNYEVEDGEEDEDVDG